MVQLGAAVLLVPADQLLLTLGVLAAHPLRLDRGHRGLHALLACSTAAVVAAAASRAWCWASAASACQRASARVTRACSCRSRSAATASAPGLLDRRVRLGGAQRLRAHLVGDVALDLQQYQLLDLGRLIDLASPLGLRRLRGRPPLGNRRRLVQLLFQACKSGQVSVLIGSTGKMGVGTNVQARAVALHHLDCPWRPADLQQRDGRILRQGNQSPEVEIYRYVVEGSFDGYSWQTVARKAGFISQVMRGRLDVREIEDIGDSALSYNEVKALAAGNPLLLDKARADTDLARLDRLERSDIQSRTRLRYSIEQNERAIDRLTTEATHLQAAIARRRDTRGETFLMTVDGRRYDDRGDAGQALRDRLALALSRPGPSPTTIHGVAELGGLTFSAAIWRDDLRTGYELAISGVPRSVVDGSKTQLLESKPASLPIRMENRVAGLDKTLAETRHSIEGRRTEITRTLAQLEQPFAHTHALAEARRRVAELDRRITDLAETTTDDDPAAPPAVEATPDPAPAEQRTPPAPRPPHPALTAAATIGRRLPERSSSPRPAPTGSGSPDPAEVPQVVSPRSGTDRQPTNVDAMRRTR